MLASVPDLTEVKDPSRHFDLIYDDDLTEAIQEIKIDTEEKMMILAKAAKILRQDILDCKQNFSGTFTSSSGIELLSQQMLSFVQLLLDGPGILIHMDTSGKCKTSVGNTLNIPTDHIQCCQKKIPKPNKYSTTYL